MGSWMDQKLFISKIRCISRAMPGMILWEAKSYNAPQMANGLQSLQSVEVRFRFNPIAAVTSFVDLSQLIAIFLRILHYCMELRSNCRSLCGRRCQLHNFYVKSKYIKEIRLKSDKIKK